MIGAVFAVVLAFSDPPEQFSRPRGWEWAWVGPWLITACTAAFGEDRSWFERAWRGAVALLFAVAVVVAVWRHYRWRWQARRANNVPPPPDPSAQPDS
ncbi:hypothetical protein Pen02_30550 [Plantactinospora endophytica]|uniref:Uncharacterized protein n=1 Tax=Plantactinospora endophytica TaxID=673535 RepID=A0ABQ4E082_9ACTN|nr:hypothetical protein Pen02_30550 [Plantactinospora endophytica]